MDHHATTPTLPEVVEEMLPYFSEKFGNPASATHQFGETAAAAVDRARSLVAGLIGANPQEIVFTSGATESNNLALRGVTRIRKGGGGHIVTSVIEHQAILETLDELEQDGIRVTRLGVDRFGRVDPEKVREAIDAETILVSIQFANGEIGTVQPIAEIGRITRERRIPFHTDAVQAAGRLKIRVVDCGVDLMSLSAHKMYGPKGIGALYVRKGIRVAPQITGGGQEGNLRSGTLNVPAIVGFGKACEMAREGAEAEAERVSKLRDRLWDSLRRRITDIRLNGHPDHRLPNNLHCIFRYVDGEAVVRGADGVALSTGSACSTGDHEPSYVIRSLGVADEESRGSVRFGLGRSNTDEQVDQVAERIEKAVRRLREISPLAPEKKPVR